MGGEREADKREGRDDALEPGSGENKTGCGEKKKLCEWKKIFTNLSVTNVLL